MTRKKDRHLCVMPGCDHVATWRVEGKTVCGDHQVEALADALKLADDTMATPMRRRCRPALRLVRDR